MAKAGIHPNYELATITCACGAVHETASTRGSFTVEICSKCHPFYTGRQKLMDTAGRIERFQRRYQLKPGAVAPADADRANKAAKADNAARPDARAEAPKADKKPKPDKAEGKAEARPEGAKADAAEPAAKPVANKADKKPAPAKA